MTALLVDDKRNRYLGPVTNTAWGSCQTDQERSYHFVIKAFQNLLSRSLSVIRYMKTILSLHTIETPHP